MERTIANFLEEFRDLIFIRGYGFGDKFWQLCFKLFLKEAPNQLSR